MSVSIRCNNAGSTRRATDVGDPTTDSFPFSWQLFFCLESRRRQRKVLEAVNGILVEMEACNVLTLEYTFDLCYCLLCSLPPVLNVLVVYT